MAEINTYNQEDIKRYLQQTMPPTEMHAFEQALMNDPFLADALDGLGIADPGVSKIHLAEIEKKIAGEKEEAKVVVLPAQKKVWWRMAAMVAVVLSAGWITYSLVSNTTLKKEIAQQQVPQANSAKVLKADSLDDSNSVLADTQKIGSGISSDQKPNSPNTPPGTLKSKAAAGDDYHMALSSASGSATAASPTTAEKNSETESKKEDAPVVAGYFKSSAARMMAANEEFAVSGKITDENGQHIPNAAIVTNNKTIVISDSGTFNIITTDSVLSAIISAPGYEAKKVEITNAYAINNIILFPLNQRLDEVVVTAIGSRKKPHLFTDTANSAEPKGGWNNFNKYIYQRIDSLKNGEDNSNDHENIVLEFLVDNRGRPTDIRVIEQANKSLGDKAVDMLSKGPGWKNKKKDKKVQVVIPF